MYVIINIKESPPDGNAIHGHGATGHFLVLSSKEARTTRVRR
jgi:hypothetical protein